MNKFQRKQWDIVTLNMRLSIPLILHILNISVIDFYTKSLFKLKTDISTLLFCVVVNTLIGCIPHLLPKFYRPKSIVREGVIDILLQIIVCDLCFRIFIIPTYYFLHYICRGGHLVSTSFSFPKNM